MRERSKDGRRTQYLISLHSRARTAVSVTLCKVFIYLDIVQTHHVLFVHLFIYFALRCKMKLK